MTIKEIWTKIKGCIGWVIAGIGAVIFAILGIRKGKADKQVKENEKVVETIETKKEEVKEETKKVEQVIDEAEKVVKKTSKTKKKVDSASSDIKKQVKENEAVLEKYKK